MPIFGSASAAPIELAGINQVVIPLIRHQRISPTQQPEQANASRGGKRETCHHRELSVVVAGTRPRLLEQAKERHQ